MKNLNLTAYLLALSLIVTLNSCRKITCEEFNLNQETMDWHFFPDLKPEYIFYDSDSTNQTSFKLTHFIQSQEKEFSCHMCACYPTLESKFVSVNNDIVFENTAVYEALEGNVQSSITYKIDNLESFLDVTNLGLVQYIDNRNYFKEFLQKEIDSVIINGRTFKNLTQFEIINTSKTKIEVFWVQKEIGMIGFKVANKNWLR